MRKISVWELLLERHFFEDRKEAVSWILMGKVFINGVRVDKCGNVVSPDADIMIKGYDMKYVNKGGLKLEGALRDFQMNVNGLVAIDAGASTGGFTDCLLQHGAAQVYAVDVGYGQLAGRLRLDPRVVNMEKVNISDINAEKLDPVPVLGTVDLSYLSLKKAIPVFAAIQREKGELLCLVKPLFEVEDSQIRRTGQLEDPKIFKEILQNLVAYIDASGYKTVGITNSAVTGNKGTREFFIRVKLDAEAFLTKDITPLELKNQIDRAVALAMELERYRK